MSVYDKDKARLSFDRAAHRYDQSAKLQQQVARHLINLVSTHSKDPFSILDMGCGTGQVTEAVCRLYPESEVFALDFAEKMLMQTQSRLAKLGVAVNLVCADAEQLPFSANSFDLITSSLMLQWSNDLSSTLKTCNSTLNGNGKMVFSTFVEGTLLEIKQSWQIVDQSEHTSRFLSEEALQSMVGAVGFSRYEVVYETIIMTYSSVREMIQEMKQIGASNAHKDRDRGLTGKQRFKAFESAFEQYRLSDGRYPCTWKVAYLICDK